MTLLARIDRRGDDPKTNPYFVAFLNAHNKRIPVPFVAYPFTEWLDVMYEQFFRLKGYQFPSAPRSSLAHNLNVTKAQAEGFQEWLLEEGKKDDCPRCEELMNAHIVGTIIKFTRNGNKVVRCPTCDKYWNTSRKGGGMVNQAARRHVKGCGRKYLIQMGVRPEDID